MSWQNYRLHFGQEYVQGDRLFKHLFYTKEKPTTITFKARTMKEADKKARKFMRQAELRGIYHLKEEMPLFIPAREE